MERHNAFVTLDNFINGDSPVYLKLEGLNIAGSIKLKAAESLLDESEKAGLLAQHGHVIESSSGNLGIALAITCAQRGYQFTCVTDMNANAASIRLMQAYGAEVIVCDQKDANGGYLGKRLELIAQKLQDDPKLYWTNQYANPANPLAHFRWTAPEVLERHPKCKWLFIGAGTTGTLMGCARYLREHAPWVNLVAVDTVGSITFDDRPGPRYVPGLGTSRRPEIFDSTLVDRVVHIDEITTVKTCHHIASQHSILVGGSTGTVLAAVQKLQLDIQPDDEVVAISPDLGERYLDTIYNEKWCRETLAMC